MEKDEEMYTMRQAAKLYKRSVSAIFFLIKKQRIAATRDGRRWWLKRSDLDHYFKTRYSRQHSTFEGEPTFDKDKGEYSAPEAAKALRIPVTTMYYYLRVKKIPWKKKRFSYVVDIKDIEALREEMKKFSKLKLTKS